MQHSCIVNIGQACFVCESALIDMTPSSSLTCPYCPNVKVKSLTGPELVKHMGAHILHDHRVKGGNQPCGFCLSFGGACKIVLRRGRGADKADVIDKDKSRCPNIRKLQLRTAEEFTSNNPCTNRPLPCPVCEATVWKYNLEQHLDQHHPTSNKENYMYMYALHVGLTPEECEDTYMKATLKAPTRQGTRKAKASVLSISAHHSSKKVLDRSVYMLINVY